MGYQILTCHSPKEFSIALAIGLLLKSNTGLFRRLLLVYWTPLSSFSSSDNCGSYILVLCSLPGLTPSLMCHESFRQHCSIRYDAVADLFIQWEFTAAMYNGLLEFSTPIVCSNFFTDMPYCRPWNFLHVWASAYATTPRNELNKNSISHEDAGNKTLMWPHMLLLLKMGPVAW